MDDLLCSFCGIAVPALPMLPGPNNLRICVYCLVKAQKIIGFMKQNYICDFCGKSRWGDSLAEGPRRIHICDTCIEAALDSLRANPSPQPNSRGDNPTR